MNKQKLHLIYDSEGAKRNAAFIKMHYEICKKMNVGLELEIIEKNFDKSKYKLPDADAVLVRTINPDLSKYLEEEGLLVYNNAKLSQIANNKYRAAVFMEKEVKIPTIPGLFIEKNKLDKKILTSHLGCVIKSLDGHGGSEVYRINEDNQDLILNKLFQKDLLIQPYIESRARDIRIYVVGREIVGAVKRQGKNGFKSNYSLGGHIERYKPQKQEINYVKKIMDKLEVGMIGIDFLEKENGEFVFNEIEDVVGTRMFYKTHPEINILEKYIKMIIENIRKKQK